MRIDLIHRGKVLHVREEDVDLHDVVDVGAGRLEHSCQILDALVLFRQCQLGVREAFGFDTLTV